MMIKDSALNEALIQCGWSQGRRVDVSHWVSKMESAGFVMHSAAIAILSSFGRLKTPRRIGPAFSTEVLEFDPDLIGVYCGRRFKVEGFLGTTLSPIGEYGPSVELFADEAGRLIGLWDSACVFSWGDSLEECLCKMILGTERPVKTRLPDELHAASSMMGKLPVRPENGQLPA